MGSPKNTKMYSTLCMILFFRVLLLCPIAGTEVVQHWTMLTLAASCWLPPESHRWCKQLRTKKWLVTLWSQTSSCKFQWNFRITKLPFLPKNHANRHIFWATSYSRKPKIHTSNGRTIGPTWQRFIYQWMIVDVKQRHHVIPTLPVDPWYPYVSGEMLNPNSEPETCVLHQIYEVCLTTFIHTHAQIPHIDIPCKTFPSFFLPTSRWWDLNSINPKAVKVGAIVLLDPMVWCHGGRQWWHLIIEDADDSHGHDELAIDCFYILHQIDAWWLFSMYMDDLFTSW